MIAAQNVVDILGTDSRNVPVARQLKVVKAKRLPNRYTSKLPLMKISFRSLSEKS